MGVTSITVEIRRIKEAVEAAYKVCEEMGAEMPEVRNVEGLAHCIGTLNVVGKNQSEDVQ